MRKPHNKPATNDRARRGERRTEILAAARELFTARGYEHTSMAEIATHIGIAEGTLYLYFDGKLSLVVAVATDWFGEIVEATEREAATINDPLDRMRFLIHRHLEVVVLHREMYLIFLREVRAGDAYGSSPLRQINRRYTGLLRALFQRLLDEGRLAAGLDPRTMRDLVYGGAEHVAWSATLGSSGGFDMARKADEVATAFARAFGLSPAAPADLEQRLRRIEAKLQLD